MLNFRYVIRVSQLCKFPSSADYGQAAGQGLQVAEVGVIFLSRSALGSRPVPGLCPAQLAAPGPGQQRLVTAPSALALSPGSSLFTRLDSVSVGLLCCRDTSEATQGRATCQR